MGADNIHILKPESRGKISNAMRCQWNEDENEALRKVPWRARVVYLQGIRWKMDFRTGIAGLSSVISYQQLHEVLTCSDAGSTKPDPEINKEGLRAIFRMLERADLVKWLKRPQKGLVFQCTLAFSDHSEQKEDNPKTTPESNPTSNPSEARNRNGSSDTRNPSTTPRQPKQDNPPPVSGKEKRREENRLVDLAAPIDRSSPESIVFVYWQETMGHKRAKLDAKRKRAITARLREGHTVDDIKQAIDGCKASPWHQGKNDRQAKFDDIELICRDAVKLDRFRAAADQADQQSNELDDWLNEDKIIEGDFNVVG